jgi:hypothetical protein
LEAKFSIHVRPGYIYGGFLKQKAGDLMTYWIALLFILIMFVGAFAVLRQLVGARTGIAAGGCEAAKVDWTEAMQYFFMTQMMVSPLPTLVGRAPLVLDDGGRVVMFGTSPIQYGQEGRIVMVGTADVTYGADGRAVEVGITPVAYNEQGQITAVGRVPITYEVEHVAMIGDACAIYDDSGRLIRIGWDPVVYANLSK